MKKRILMMALMAVLALGANAQGYQPGDVASDFKLKNYDGKTVSLADYKNAKGILLVFTCNPCPYAKAYEQRMMDLDKKYAAKGYPVVAINPNDPERSPDDSFENIKKRALERKYTFPYLKDETQEITRIYGAKATPHLYILQKEGGKFKVAYVGAIDNDTENTKADKIKYAENAIEALMNGKQPEVKETKAIGCTIKWKKSS